jgi:Tfp pilus assembly protein PilN
VAEGEQSRAMNIRLNLATKPILSHRSFLAGAALLGLLAGFLFLGLGWRYYSLRKADTQLRARTQELQSEMARLQAQRADLDRFFAKPENVALVDRASFISSVIQARSINWTQMFMDLEHTLPPGVHVVRIEPRLEKGIVSVKFVIGAANQEAELKLLKAFEESKSFSRVELTSEHASTQPGTDPVTVEFTAVYSTV